MGSAILVPVNQEEIGRGKIVKKLTQKRLEYQISVLEEKRRKLKSKLERKSKEIDHLLYLTKNRITVEESMIQFNNVFKMFDSAENQYLQLRDKEDGADTYFEDIDNWVFEYKHKIYSWLREAERESLQCLQEGVTNQVKVVHLAVQKFLLFFLFRKIKEYQRQGN